METLEIYLLCWAPLWRAHMAQMYMAIQGLYSLLMNK